MSPQVIEISKQLNVMLAHTDQELVDLLQAAKERRSVAEKEEKAYADLLKQRGLGTYEGTIADCSVIEYETTRINVDKLIKKLNIAKHVFDRFYTITSTNTRATIVPKKFLGRKAA